MKTMTDGAERIVVDERVMGGAPCIKGTRCTVGMIKGMLQAGRTHEDVLALYPYLKAEDLVAAVAYGGGK